MHTATIELPSRWQPDLFADQVALARFDVATTPEIESALDSQAPVFIGVSGGKDSQALAYRLCDHLDNRSHAGPRLLIHCDLAAWSGVSRCRCAKDWRRGSVSNSPSCIGRPAT